MNNSVYTIKKLRTREWLHMPVKDHIEHLIVKSNIIQPKLLLRSMRLRVRKLLRKKPEDYVISFWNNIGKCAYGH